MKSSTQETLLERAWYILAGMLLGVVLLVAFPYTKPLTLTGLPQYVVLPVHCDLPVECSHPECSECQRPSVKGGCP